MAKCDQETRWRSAADQGNSLLQSDARFGTSDLDLSLEEY